MKKTSFLLTLAFSLLLGACGPDDEQQETAAAPSAPAPAPAPVPEPPAPAMEASLLWEIPGLHRPESAHYDPQRERIYVSNLGGGPLDKTRSGFLTVVAPEGLIDQLRWVDKLQAPKGLALCQDALYVADLDEILQINADTGEISNTWEVEDAGFLNDVACSPDGSVVYISDMRKNRIYAVEDASLSLWLESPELENPNGLLGTEQGLIVASWGVMMSPDDFSTEAPGHLKVVDYQSKTIQPLNDARPLGHLDGVERDQRAGYLVSDWMSGDIFWIADGQSHTVLTLAQGAADIGYIPHTDVLLVPMMEDSALRAFQLEPNSSGP